MMLDTEMIIKSCFFNFLFDLSYYCHYCTIVHVIYHYATPEISQKNSPSVKPGDRKWPKEQFLAKQLQQQGD